jgi:hypothetical protein
LLTMAENEIHSPNQGEMISINKRTFKRLIGILILISLIVGVWFIFLRNGPQNKSEDISALQTAKQSVSFPVFYAKPQPTYTLDPSSVSTSRGLISFAYKYGEDIINVSEQPKPLVIEQVTKTREFDTPIGSAYLADLNGHTAGFIQTEKTLIILSSQNIIADKLKTLMSNFKKLS